MEVQVITDEKLLAVCLVLGIENDHGCGQFFRGFVQLDSFLLNFSTCYGFIVIKSIGLKIMPAKKMR